MAIVELHFGSPENVRTARLLAGTLARRAGVADELVDEVKLAVGEACARAFGADPAQQEIVVAFDDGDPAAYVVTVRDHGPAVAREAFEETLAGTVIAGLVADLAVGAAGTGTLVRMAWPRAAATTP